MREARALAASAAATTWRSRRRPTGWSRARRPTRADRDRARSARADRRRARRLAAGRRRRYRALHHRRRASSAASIGGVVVHSVYEAAPNVAITAFDARPATPAARPPPQAYLEVANYSPRAQQVRVVAHARHRGRVRPAGRPGRRRSRSAGRAARRGGGPRLLAQDQRPGQCAGDRRRGRRVDPGRRAADRRRRERKAGSALAQLLKRDPSVRVDRDGAGYVSAGQGGRRRLRSLGAARGADRPALLVAPPLASWIRRVGRRTRRTPRWSAAGNASRADRRRSADARHQDARGHWYAAGTTIGRDRPGAVRARHAARLGGRSAGSTRQWCSALRSTDSNLAFAPAFPVLVGNALEWLARPTLEVTRQPGPMTLPSSVTPRRRTGRHGRAARCSRRSAGRAICGRRVSISSRPAARAAWSPSTSAIPRSSNLARTTLAGGERPVRAAGVASGRPWWMYGVLARVRPRRRRVVDVAAADHGVTCR